MALVIGLFLFALGIVLLLESGLGLSPWDVFHQGIARHSPLSFGLANVAVGVVVLALAWLIGTPPGVGTAANATLVGIFIDLLTPLDAIAALADAPLGVRVLLLVAGIALCGLATALYIGAGLGAGPRDSLMLATSLRTGSRIGLVRAGIELSVLVAGIALGGTFGIGTVAFALLIGPAVEASFGLLSRSALST